MRRITTPLLVGLVLLTVVPLRVLAQGMPFHTPTALPIALAEGGIRSFYQRLVMGSMVRNGREVANPQGLRVAVDAVPLMVPYGLRRGTVVTAGIPYVHRTFEDGGSTRSNGGPGDLFVVIKQELIASDFIAGNRRLALFAGATFPTGQTKAGATSLPVPLRLGLGAVNLQGQAVFSYVNNRFGAHGGAGYAAATGTTAGVRLGDRVRYDLAVGYRVAPRVYETLRDATVAAYLELNGTVERASTQSGSWVADTGGHILFLSPGLQVIPRPNLAVEGSLQLAIVREPRGTQLVPDWTLAAGVRTLFSLFGR